MVSENEVARVKVGLGYSTLLQFDARPSQAIVGDQDSFKIEYVGSAIAIKPLVSGVSTNLFVVTDAGKFNFRISAIRGLEPDYVLRIKRKSADPVVPNSTKVTVSNASVTRDGLRLNLLTVASNSSNSVLIYSFQVLALNRARRFEPGDFEIIQFGSLPIESIYLDRMSLKIGERLNGLIVVRRSEIKRQRKVWLRLSEARGPGLRVVAPPN